MLSDLKSAFRALRQSPGFTAAAVLVLALGLGANTAIFSVVEAALLRPLPFPETDRLVRIYEGYDDTDTRANTLNLSEITLQRWREQGGDIFSDIGGATGAPVTLGATGDRPARSLSAARVTASFFSTLGLAPVLGRNFTPEEDVPHGPRVALISYDVWQSEFDGRPDVLGKTLLLDDARWTVVGVLPKHFRHPYRADIWTPLGATYDPSGLNNRYLYCAARLRPGVTIAQADAALRRICASADTAAPSSVNPRRGYVRPLHEGFVVDLQPKLLVISGAALCTLLVAAANFAGLLLARSVAREGETAIRAALGASRARLVRETLAQALLLAAAGAVAGLLITLWLTPALVALSPEGSDHTGSAMREFDHAVRLDWPVFAFAAGALVLVGAGFGLLPAWRAARTDLRSAMHAGSRSATLDRGTRRLLGGLVVAEIAAAAVLLVSSALLTQYFKKLVDEPWGFRPENRVTFDTMFSNRLFATGEAHTRTIDQTLAQLRALPGVTAASATFPQPVYSSYQLIGLNVAGVPAPETRGVHMAYLRGTTPGYFATVGQALLRGRDFTADDRAGTAPVVIVSESFAKRFWPGRDPVGQRVKWGRFDGPRPWLTVVGVVADTKTSVDPNDGEVVGSIVLPLAQALAVSSAFEQITFVLHTGGPPLALESAARSVLARVDSRLALFDLYTIEAGIEETRTTERFALVLISLFGVLGLVLAAIGLYGLLALQVTRRTKEFGVRSALGATAANLARLVLGEGALLLTLGLGLGGAAAWAAHRLIQSRWSELPALSFLPFAAALAILAAAAALACWLPARRAAKADPMTALRAE